MIKAVGYLFVGIGIMLILPVLSFLAMGAAIGFIIYFLNECRKIEIPEED